MYTIGSPLPRGKVVFAPTTPSAAHTNNVTRQSPTRPKISTFAILSLDSIARSTVYRRRRMTNDWTQTELQTQRGRFDSSFASI